MTTLILNRLSWARLVSDLCSPPVVLSVLGVVFAHHDSPEQGGTLAALYVTIAVVFPLAVLSYWVYQGHITDLHMPERRERYAPFALYLACSALAWVALRLVGHFNGLMLLSSFLLVETFIALAVTFYWQISVHAGIMTGAVVMSGLILGPETALLLSPLIVLVAAARLHLRRHTPAQVAAGIAVGALVPLLIQVSL